MQRPRILLADDHALFSAGLKSLLEDEFDIVATVTDGRALVQAAKELRPDVIIADISMPLLNGIDAARQLKKEGYHFKILFLSMHTEVPLVTEAFGAGGCGYLLKQSAGEELKTAVQEVLRGRTYITPLISGDLMYALTMLSEHTPRQERLTPRQREVLQLIAEGKTMKEIASLLNISTRTAESHKYEMMQELGVERTAELIQYAIKIGLVAR